MATRLSNKDLNGRLKILWQLSLLHQKVGAVYGVFLLDGYGVYVLPTFGHGAKLSLPEVGTMDDMIPHRRVVEWKIPKLLNSQTLCVLLICVRKP